jgi:hypothetical protein
MALLVMEMVAVVIVVIVVIVVVVVVVVGVVGVVVVVVGVFVSASQQIPPPAPYLLLNNPGYYAVFSYTSF